MIADRKDPNAQHKAYLRVRSGAAQRINGDQWSVYAADGDIIHEESVRDFRGRFARLLGLLRHRHFAVRRTWTMDESPWFADPNALDYCECGAKRRLWGDHPWRVA